MVRVHHISALHYCAWASSDDLQLTLPSEAQWEHAARGPRNFKYPWGDEWDGSKCCNSVWMNSLSGTAKSALYPANGFGLYDMAGNSWHRCLDWYDADFLLWLKASSLDPVNLVSGAEQYHVVRGGSWGDNSPEDFRASYRNYVNPKIWTNTNNIGFRCACTADIS